MTATAQLLDLTNASSIGNSSSFFGFDVNQWQNSTQCSNFGTPRCANFTGYHNSSAASRVKAAGGARFNGSSLLLLWTNATNFL